MGKLPWFKFFPGDWMKDPELRAVSSGARGLWIDMLNLMFESVRRGHLSLKNGSIVTAEYLAHMTGNSTDDVSRWLQELDSTGVFSRTDTGVIFSRRMVRDEIERERVRKAMAKSRGYRDVTKTLQPLSDSEPELTDFDVGFEERKEPRRIEDQELEMAVQSGSDALVERIVSLHPANWRDKGKLQVPHAQAVAIIAAIARDGPELVEQGTEHYGLAVAKWPIEERKFVLSPVKFWAESHYLRNPQLWERGNHGESRQIQKLQRSYEVIQAAVERSNGNADLGVCEVREGIDSPGSAIVARSLAKSTPRSN